MGKRSQLGRAGKSQQRCLQQFAHHKIDVVVKEQQFLLDGGGGGGDVILRQGVERQHCGESLDFFEGGGDQMQPEEIALVLGMPAASVAV